MPSTRVLPLALAALLLAGCAGGSTSSSSNGTLSAAEASSTAPTTTAPPPPPPQAQTITAKTPILLEARASPEGALTAFRWTAPKGTAFSSQFTSISNSGQLGTGISNTTTLQFFAEVPKGLTDLAVMVLSLKDDSAQLLAQYISSTLTTTSKLGPLPTTTTTPPHNGTFSLSVAGGDDGDSYAIVVAASGPASSTVRVGFHSIHEQFFFDDGSTTELQDIAGNRTWARMPATGHGTGLQIAEYNCFNALGISGQEEQSKAATVTDALPRVEPMATVRDVVVGATHKGAGFTYASGRYFGDNAQGLWAVNGDAHGATLSAHSVILEHLVLAPYLLLGELIVFGTGSWTTLGDGAGDASTSYHVQVVREGIEDILDFVQLDLGTPLAQLAGTSVASGSFADTGLAGNVPPSAMPASMRMTDQHLMTWDGHVYTVEQRAPTDT